MSELHPGSVHECAYPFVLERMTLETEEGPTEKLVWNPGARHVLLAPDDTEAVHDGMGARIATVVSVHKPGPRYPARVFYTLQWRDPTGRLFGKPKLRIATAEKFRRHASGYAHETRPAEAGEWP